MIFINADQQLPTPGKEVLIILTHRTHRYYGLGYYCCKDGWKYEGVVVNDEVLMWAELPPLEPE